MCDWVADARRVAMWVLLAASLQGGAFAQEQHAAQVAGYWTTDARWQSTIRSKTRQDYFWVGRMWGRIDATGKVRFDADNGCIALGLLAPSVANYSWSGTVNVSNCQVNDMDGRYDVSVSGGKPHLSLRFHSMRMMPGLKQDVYEVNGTFSRYNPLGSGIEPVRQGAKTGVTQVTTQQQGEGTGSYEGRLKALIRPNITRPVGTLPEGPVTVDVEISTAQGGKVRDVRLVRPSGSPAWDSAVMGAVARTGTLPRDVDGRVPPTVIVSFSAKE